MQHAVTHRPDLLEALGAEAKLLKVGEPVLPVCNKDGCDFVGHQLASGTVALKTAANALHAPAQRLRQGVTRNVLEPVDMKVCERPDSVPNHLGVDKHDILTAIAKEGGHPGCMAGNVHQVGEVAWLIGGDSRLGCNNSPIAAAAAAAAAASITTTITITTLALVWGEHQAR